MRINFNGVIGEIDSLPGNTQVAVSHSVFLSENLRGKGLGQSAMEQRLEYLENEMGYDYVLCTVRDSNETQIYLLEKNGWQFLDQYISRKTGNVVNLYGKHLGS